MNTVISKAIRTLRSSKKKKKEMPVADGEEKRHLETRIRERAYTIWLDEGKPEGRHLEHWNIAKLAIDEEDALPHMVKAVPKLATE